MQLALQEIIIRNRIRQNLGDLSGLKESIRKHGIMNPIVVNERKELIAGHRRLECARQLGWTMVPVRIIENPAAEDKLEMEIDENLYRKNLSADELADAYEKLEKLRNPGWFARIIKALRDFFARLFKRK